MSSKRIIAAVAVAALAAGVGTAVAATGSSSTASDYVPVAATRIADTRTAGALGPGKTLVVTLPAADAGATAVTVNLTAVSGTANGYLVAYPDGGARPSTSNVNYLAAQTAFDLATVPVTDGKLDVYNASAGSVQVLVDLQGYYTPSAPAYVPPQASWTATTAVEDHPDSGNDGGNWAVDSLTRTVTISVRGGAADGNCGAAATSCYLYEGSISDSGTFTTAPSKDVATDGLSPNASKPINGVVSGTVSGSSAIEFYASTAAASITGVPVTVTGPVSGNETTDNWVAQFFPAGTLFGGTASDVENLLNWTWTYTATSPADCETWVDGFNGESGDITGVNACTS